MWNVANFMADEVWIFFRGMLLKGDPGDFVFLKGWLPKRETQKLRNYGMVLILLSCFCNYDNLALKLCQNKHSYPEEGWHFVGRFKVGSLPGIIIVLVASKKCIKICYEYDARPLIKSYDVHNNNAA